MSADKTSILAGLAELVSTISDALLPGEEITMETRLVEDLELQSLGLVNLGGRIQTRYGAECNLVPFFAGREAGPFADLRVGEIVDYLAGILDGAEASPATAPAAGATEALVARLVAGVAGRSPAPGRTFEADGFTLSEMLRVTGVLDARFGTQSKTLLLDCPTVAELATYLDQRYGAGPAAELLAVEPFTAGGAAAGGAGQEAPGMLGSLSVTPDGPAARNDNAAVLAELAPGTVASLVLAAGGQVEVFTAGAGEPLILMHPINVGAGVFARQFARLAGQYRVICMHGPGVGATTWDAEVTLSGIARLHRTVLAELSVEPPFHVLGSSFGGLVAQQFALLHPAECASLTLVGCSYRAGARPGVRKLPTVARGEFDRMHDAGADLTMEGDRTGLEELLLRCESMDTRIGMKYLDAFAARPTLYSRLPDITAPTLVLRGRHDTMVPAKHAHLLYGAIPDARLEEIPDAGHFPCLTHPAQIDRLVLPFLTAHPVPQRPAGRTGVLNAAVRGAPAAAQASVIPAPPEPCSIIISSGRCGSTLLSALVAEEPETMSASESLAMVRPHLTLMPLTELTGAQYWSLMSEPSELGSLMTRLGVVPSEYRYPAGGRFAGDQSTIPPILYVTLPGISADPDLLFGVLAEKVPQFPAQRVGLHHKMLLNLMASLTGKRRWIERSGASSALAQPLLEAFGEAKIVYLTRNIEDTAKSMSRHASFQFAAVRHEFHLRYGTDPYARWARKDLLPDPEDMPEEVRRLLPDRLTAETLREMSQDPARYEAMCAHMMGSAEQALADMKPRHLHRIRYEDLLADPRDELTRLGEFLGFADPSGWAEGIADRVKSPRASSVRPA